MTNNMYDPQWVREYYDAEGLKEWNRFDLHPVLRVSFAVHNHYLQKFLASTDRVLEIGAGCGRFTQVLAGLVPRITVADISPKQLALNRQQADDLGFASVVEQWVECDICDLQGQFDDAAFDAVVCYGGALSYVYDQADLALQEMKRVTKPDGLIFLEVMTLWGAVHSALLQVLALPVDYNRTIISSGNLDGSRGQRFHHIHMYRAQEFRELLERQKFAIEVLSASAVLSTNLIDQLRDIPEDSDNWQHLLEMELEACREPGCLDLGTHLIAVCRKAK